MSFKAKQFIPLFDNVIIKPIKVEEKSGFIRPQNEEDKAELGEVISVGELVKDNGRIKAGDIILFNKYSSTKLDMGDELVVRAEDCIAILKTK